MFCYNYIEFYLNVYLNTLTFLLRLRAQLVLARFFLRFIRASYLLYKHQAFVMLIAPQCDTSAIANHPHLYARHCISYKDVCRMQIWNNNCRTRLLACDTMRIEFSILRNFRKILRKYCDSCYRCSYYFKDGNNLSK